MRVRIGLLAVVASSVLLSGCGQEPAGPDAVNAQAVLDEITEMSARVDAVESRLIRQCLVKLGFTVFPEDGDAPAQPPANVGAMSPTLDLAMSSGYDLDPAAIQRSGRESAGTTAWDALPDSEKLRFTLAEHGDPNDRVTYEVDGAQVSYARSGCRGEVAAALVGDVRERIRLQWLISNTMRINADREAFNDASVLAAVEAWRDCMVRGGYDGVEAPRDARQRAAEAYEKIDLSDAAALSQAKATEIAVATADARCAEESTLNETLAAVRAKARARELVEHEADLVAYRDLLQDALKRGQALLEPTP
jgi:hypothetical protein